VVLCLDLTGLLLVQAAKAGFYEQLQGRSVTVVAAVYDLLPITLPQVFPSGAEVQHTQWVQAITGFDKAVCISAHVAQQLREWLVQHGPESRLAEPRRVTSWCLGSDITASQPTQGLLADMTGLDAALSAEHCFLMVGTIEPRKGYDDVLGAMELLWRTGNTTPLIVVGRAGWRHLPPEERQHIDATCDYMEHLASQYPWMIWLNDASDELLDYVYAGASHVLCASLDEGFGLPIVEALKHNKQVLARDIPVFREVGGNAVQYLMWGAPDALAVQLQMICGEARDKATDETVDELTAHSPETSAPALMSWAESATQLLRAITPDS
jgi:glycosyltransferase involved in cell wall biosynthesis